MSVRTLMRALRHLGVFLLLLPATGWAQNETTGSAWAQFYKKSLYVNCDRGQKLARAIKRARAGATIYVKGTCKEQVLITKSHLRIRGVNGAVIDGDIGRIVYEGTLTIRAARGVTISNLTVRNGPDQGIVVQQNATVALKNVTTHGNATVGVTVDASYLEASNVVSYNNGTGFDFFTGATVIALGPLAATDNTGAGVAINADSTMELRGAVVSAKNNGGDGILIVNNSSLLILSFPESQGSGVDIEANRGAAGIFAANSNISSVGSQFAGSGANPFNISGHGVGMLLISSNLASPFGTATFNITMNGVGMLFTDNSDAIVVGGLRVSGNNVGVLGDGAGVLRLRQSDLNNSEVTNNNGPDVLMQFGSRLELGEAIARRVVCDPTVITPAGACP